VWEDLEEFLPLVPSDQHPIQKSLGQWAKEPGNSVMAVNHVGTDLNCRLAHWVSQHAHDLILRFLLRETYALDCRNIVLHSMKHDAVGEREIDVAWRMVDATNLSGLFAVKIAVSLGYDRIIMAGCPMDGTGRYYDEPKQRGCYDDPNMIVAWRNIVHDNPEIQTRVRSLSGKTREILGEPERCAV
jgi:hypothetical protein